MAEEEEDKGPVEKLLELTKKVTGVLGRFSPGQLYPGQPLIGPEGPVKPGSVPGLTDPVVRNIVERERRAKLPDPVRKRLEAGEDALRAPDPVPLPGPVQEADESERSGVAISHPNLFESGLVTASGQRTPIGDALVSNSQASGEDLQQMIRFYSQGLIDENLQVTERGTLSSNIDLTGTLDQILSVNDREEGFRLFLEAEKSGAIDRWQEKTGRGANTAEEFVVQAAKSLPSDVVNMAKMLQDFVPGAPRFYNRLIRDSGPAG